MKNYFRQILTSFTKNHYSETIRQNFYGWLTDKEHAVEKDKALKEIWTTARAMGEVPHVEKELERWKRNNGLHTASSVPVTPNRKIRILRFWQSVAAVLLLAAVSLGYLVMQAERTQNDLIQEFIPVAGMRHLSLPDGSQVQLNSKSTLLYPKQFTGKERCVYLVGEANFKVKPDKKHPFIVKANDYQVTALGTEFNVNAYPENSELMATLLEGSVKVEFNNLLSNIILKPNEQLVYDKHTKAHNLRMPEIDDVTAWQRGELVFSNMYLEDIFTSLERKFPYAFVYSLHSLKKNTYSFRFSKQANLEEVMKIISQVVGNVNYVIKGNKCYVTSKE